MSSFWDNRPIKQKLLLGIGAILIIFAVSSGVVLLFVNSLANSAATALEVIVPLHAAAQTTQTRLTDGDDHGAYALLGRDATARSADLKIYADDMKQVADAITLLRAGAATADELDALSQFAAWFADYQRANDHAFALQKSGNSAQAISTFMGFPTQKGQDLLEHFAGSTKRRADAASAQVGVGAHVALISSIVGALTAISTGLLIAMFLGASVSKRLNTVSSAMQEVVHTDFAALGAAMKQLASGNLTTQLVSNRHPIDARGTDEMSILATSYNELVAGMNVVGSEFNATSEMLTALILEIQSAVEHVGTAAREIAAGNLNLAQRTEEQAAGLEQTASSMEQFTATVRQNADNAQSANELGTGARHVATSGGTVMRSVVDMMDSIHLSSKKIVEIISVIDGIAFQTNILALNAAVEAARAGEQGRGFAVVAGEVRTLAQRSAAAAKEIKGLIGDTVDKVDGGTRLVEEAGKTMQELVISVSRVTDIISDIATASKEQSTGIDQVSTAISQMDDVTQQNAALVEEASAATSSLDAQAQLLVRAVSVFRLGRPDGGAARRPAEPPAASVHSQPAPRGRRASLAAPDKARVRASVATPRTEAAAQSDDQWESF